MNHSFYIGFEVIPRLREWLQQAGLHKVLLVRGKSSFTSCGAENIFSELAKEAKIPEFVPFSDFQTNPLIEDCQKGVALCNTENVDAIIGVGGGSVLDMAKLIRHFYRESFCKSLSLMVLPTTAGTGAEATHFAVCYVAGEKTSVSHEDIRPDQTLIYPPFTYHNAPYLTACTGFDAVAQAIESYWSVKSNEESQEWALQALAKLWKQLPALMQNQQNTSLRNDIAEGAYYAGRAIDLTTTTAAHAFSYKFTSLKGYPHGHAVSLTFPFWFARNTLDFQNLLPTIEPKEYALRMEKLLASIDCQANTLSDRMAFMQDYINSLGLLKGSFTVEELKPIINAFNAERAKNNPTLIDESTKKDLIKFLI